MKSDNSIIAREPADCKRYSVSTLQKDVDGKLHVVSETVITAPDMRTAWTVAHAMPITDGQYVRVLPALDIHNGDCLLAFGRYIQHSKTRWCIANDRAVISALKKSVYDIEDEISTAIVAVLECESNFTYDRFRSGLRALDRERGKLYRISESEYNPEWVWHNPFIDRIIRASHPDITRIIERAMQDYLDTVPTLKADILRDYFSGMTRKSITDIYGVATHVVNGTVYRAILEILRAVYDTPGAVDAITGVTAITRDDILTALDTYERRTNRNGARKRRNKDKNSD